MTKERPPFPSSETVILSSIADFLLVINSKDSSSIIKGIKFVLYDDPHQALLAKYVAANPTLSHVVDRLLLSILQSSDHEYMAAVMLLLNTCLGHPGRAPELAKPIITEKLKPFYRCLSSNNAICLTSVLLVLTRLASEAGDLLAHHFDLSHKGLQEASHMRRTPVGDRWGPQKSPRQAFLYFFMALLTGTDFDSRVLLSKSAFILAYLTEGELGKDRPEDIKLLLQTLLDRIIFNEENNRNLAVTFFKNRQLNKITALLSSRDELVRGKVETFLIRCFGKTDQGLAYSNTALGILRNRLLLDVLLELDPLHVESHQRIIQETASACPDAAWAFLSLTQTHGAERKLCLEPQATVDFALSVNLTIKLIHLLPAPLSNDTLIPRSISRGLLTRGISHADSAVRLSSLMLLLALLQRFAHGLLPELLLAAREVLPDYRTLYNGWRANALRDEESAFVEHCYLEITRHYISTLQLGDLLVLEMVKTGDIWKALDPEAGDKQARRWYGEQLAPVAINLLKVLDPLLLLVDQSALATLTDLVRVGQKTCPDELSSWLEGWVLKVGFARERRYAHFVCEETSLQDKILPALSDLINTPLVFSQDTDPILVYFNLAPSAVPDQLMASESQAIPMIMELGVPSPSAPLILPGFQRSFEVASLLHDDRFMASSAISLVNSACALVRRKALFSSYAAILPDIQWTAPNSYEELIDLLVNYHDCPTWLSLLAKALVEEEEEKEKEKEDVTREQQLDLRLLVESGILGLAIIGLSLEDLLLRRLSHLILTRYTGLLGKSRIREHRQLSLILTALSIHISPDSPLAPMARPVAYFHAMALPVMLYPEHALYRPLNELFLSSPIVSAAEASRRLLFDANEGWQRMVHWALLWLEAAIGREGRAAGACQISALHIPENLFTLLLGTGLEPATRELARKLLVCLAEGKDAPVPAPAWISITLDFIRRHP